MGASCSLGSYRICHRHPLKACRMFNSKKWRRNVSRILIIAAGFVAPSHASGVVLVGKIGDRAILSIDGGPPRTVKVGAKTREGIELKRLMGDRAHIIMKGQELVLELGGQPIEIDPREDPSITLYEDSRGHFTGVALINAIRVPFLLDTGASFLSIGKSTAIKAGIDYRAGEKIKAQTANGMIDIWLVRANRVQLGEIELRDVQTAVFEHELPSALVGMSVLSALEIRRNASQLTLRKIR